MTKSYGISPIDEFYLQNETFHESHKIMPQESSTSRLTKIVFEDGLKDPVDSDYVDLHNSLDDMIKFTEIITRRMTPSGSQESLKTQKSNPDCHCGCHEIEHDLQFINEKTQTDDHLKFENIDSVHNQETNSFVSEHKISSKHSENPSMNKPSALLLKQIYTEIKVCRCFEKYANHKKLQKTKNHPSYESIIKKEEIQQQGVLDDESHASIKVMSHRSKIETAKKQSKETVKSKSLLKPMKSQIDFDTIENVGKKEKKKSKDNFVDIELSPTTSQKSASIKEPSKKEKETKQRDSFIKRLSDPFTRRGSKNKDSK